MSISVFGLGYVGSVTAACLAERGHKVVGVDVNRDKVEAFNRGQAPVLEAGLEDYFRRNRAAGRLSATSDVAAAIAQTDLSLICVGTPSRPNGDLDLQYVCRVAEQMGDALVRKQDYHSVVVRSTVLPGTTWDTIRPLIEGRSGKKVGEGFGLCFNPEFLREGSAIADFHQPPFTVVGVERPEDAARLRALYDWLDAELIVVGTRVAETIKYVNNCFHALKVAFANEVGRLCRVLQVDSHQVMEIFCKDTKQNISSCYLKPGFAFGGSCLPKDLRAMLHLARRLDVPLELFGAILPSNQTQIDLGVQMVEQAGYRKVGLLGLSFKAGTDDLRESPLVSLAERLHGRGYELRIFDDQVSLSRLMGANRAYVDEHLPHLGALLRPTLEEVLEESETLVVGNGHPAFTAAVAAVAPRKAIVDLARLATPPAVDHYQGIGW